MNNDIIFYSASVIAIIGVLIMLIGISLISKNSSAKIGNILTVIGLVAIDVYIMTMVILYASGFSVTA